MKEARIVFDGVGVETIGLRSRPTAKSLIYLTVTFWSAQMAVSMLRSFVDRSASLAIYTEVRAFSALLGCAECYIIHRLYLRSPMTSFASRAAFLIAAATVAGMANLYAADAIQDLTKAPVQRWSGGWKIYNEGYWTLLFTVWCAMYLALCYSREVAGQERRARVLEQMAHDAQLRALRFQIDPHFLFNTLNSVSALVIGRHFDAAETMIERLSAFFRTTLAVDPYSDIALADEIELQRTYLEIERVRFPDLIIEIDLPDALRSTAVPALLLQPLIENAVKYSVGQRNEPARIAIVVSRSGEGSLCIDIENDCNRLPSALIGTGTGIRNVSERLHARFGDGASLLACEVLPNGFVVRLKMPMIIAGAQA